MLVVTIQHFVNDVAISTTVTGQPEESKHDVIAAADRAVRFAMNRFEERVQANDYVKGTSV